MSGVEAVAVQMGADWPFRCEWRARGGRVCNNSARWAVRCSVTCGCPVPEVTTCDACKSARPVGESHVGFHKTCGRPGTATIAGYRPLNEGDLPDPEERA